MRPIRFSSERLEAFFQDATVATLPQLKAALGTTVDLTVFRKLSALPYRTSYSHRGAYYTLDPLAQYDDGAVVLPRHLLFPPRHAAGHGGHAGDPRPRQDTSPMNWKRWCMWRPKTPCGSWRNRAGSIAESGKAAIFIVPASAGGGRSSGPRGKRSSSPEDDLQAAMVLFYSLLDEQQRRLYAGLESLEWGHGGDQRMAQLFGLDVDTVARGRGSC